MCTYICIATFRLVKLNSIEFIEFKKQNHNSLVMSLLKLFFNEINSMPLCKFKHCKELINYRKEILNQLILIYIHCVSMHLK